jgi:hypothetical protein
MKTRLFYLLITLVALIGLGLIFGGERIASTKWANDMFPGAVSGSGKIETETRTPGEFDSIAIAYPATIVVNQGDEYLVTVEADDNLLPQLVTTVRDGALAIENGEGNHFKRVAPTQAVKITITVKGLNVIVLARPGRVEVNSLKTSKLDLGLKSAGEIILQGLDAGALNVSMYGGEVTAAGMAKNLSVSIGGSGEFDGTDLQTLTANVQIGGTATATVRASEELSVSLSGSVTVNYYGSPEVIHESISGAASINKLGN